MKDMELYDSFIRETTDLLGARRRSGPTKSAMHGKTTARASSCCCATLRMSSVAVRTTP